MSTKHGKVVTYREGLPPLKSHNPLNTWSREVTWEIRNIFAATMHMATTLGRKEAFRQGLPLTKLHYPLIACLCEIT